MDNITLISWPRDKWRLNEDSKQAIEISPGNLFFITGYELKRQVKRYKLKLEERQKNCIRYKFIDR